MKFTRVLHLILSVLLISYSHISLAACTVSSTAVYTANFSQKQFTVGKDHVPGTPIGDAIILNSTSRINEGISCGGSTLYFFQQYANPMQPTIYPGIFKTDVEGIGMKLTPYAPTDPRVYHNDVGNDPNLWFAPYYAPGLNVFGPAPDQYTLQFYAIGPISTGDVVMSGPWVKGSVNDVNSPGVFVGTFNINGTVKFTAASCTTPDIPPVQLGKHAATDFPAVNATSEAVSFNLQVNNCNPGMASVNYTFRPAAGVTLVGSGNTQYLTLNGASLATGVGVQVLFDDGVTTVPFNTKIAVPNTGGTQGYDKINGGSFVIPMKARYIRTGTMTGGTANSALEFVMSYE
ncbi:fimbrial protein [Yokenella regensburgei]|uniref:fimbrial protein n=1 Tax=Yokenella regensburgei TaxID=158877 RepID=UPI003F140272